jgi:hypothetical protein
MQPLERANQVARLDELLVKSDRRCRGDLSLPTLRVTKSHLGRALDYGPRREAIQAKTIFSRSGSPPGTCMRKTVP